MTTAVRAAPAGRPPAWTTPQWWIGRGAFGLLVLLGLLFILRDAGKYATWTPEVYHRFWPNRWLLVIHLVTAGPALLVAPFQFITAIRRRWPRVHRATGWVYVTGALVSAPTTIALALRSDCPMCIPPFVIWAIVFFIATVLAVAMARARRIDVHRQFMIRSFVLMNGFVFFRLDNHIPFPLPSGANVNRPALLLWVSWVVPLLVTELWLTWWPSVRRSRSVRGGSSAA
jgi:uncharacterized membrane protein